MFLKLSEEKLNFCLLVIENCYNLEILKLLNEDTIYKIIKDICLSENTYPFLLEKLIHIEELSFLISKNKNLNEFIVDEILNHHKDNKEDLENVFIELLNNEELFSYDYVINKIDFSLKQIKLYSTLNYIIKEKELKEETLLFIYKNNIDLKGNF